MGMPRSLRAAVERVNMTPDRGTMTDQFSSGKKNDWQAEAWEMYETVGELAAVCRWMGSSAARVTLFAAEVDEDTGRADSPVESGPAVEMVSDMGGGPVGQADLLRQAAVLLTIVGEFYVVILGPDEDDPLAPVEDTWTIVSADQVATDASGTYTVVVDGKKREMVEGRDTVFRVWDRDPHYPDRATSSVRAALPVLREIRAMDRTIQSEAKSRVAGNGILAIPSEAQIPSSTPPSGQTVPGMAPSTTIHGAQSAANLATTLSQVMKTSIEDPESAAVVAPIVVSAPKDSIEGFKHITLNEGLTEQAVATRERAIRRLALSLDIPPEVLTGLGDSTHWNANLVDESALRQHIAPMMETIAEALTTGVLHPVCESRLRDPDTTPEDRVLLRHAVEHVVVGFDMSNLTQKQDKSQVALEAYREGVITADALRRELGFGEQDAPSQSDQDRRRALAERMVSQAPSLFPYLAEELGFGAVGAVIEQDDATAPTTPSLRRVNRIGGA